MPSIKEVKEWAKKYEEETGKHLTYGKAYPLAVEEEERNRRRPKKREPDHPEVLNRYGDGRTCRIKEDEIDMIVFMYQNGNDPNTIADKFGVSRRTIIDRLASRGIDARKKSVEWTHETDERLKILVLKGATVEEICAEIGCSKNAAYHRISSTGIGKLKRKMDKERPLRNGNSESGKEKNL